MSDYNIEPIKKLTKLDRIRKSYDEDIDLTIKEAELRQMYIECFTYMSDGNSPAQAAKMLNRNRNIPMSTAYRHVKDSTILFGNVAGIDLKGERVVLKEMLYSLYKIAIEKGDREEAHKIIKTIVKMLPDDTDQLFDMDKFEAHQYVIKIDAKVEQDIKSSISGGSVNLNGISEDVDFEKVE